MSVAVPDATARLQLRRAVMADAPFFQRLLTDPGWARNIVDRGQVSLADAEEYISASIHPLYAKPGLGMWVIQRATDGIPLGVTSAISRDDLAAPDLGFGLLQAYSGQGYAREAARSTLAYMMRMAQPDRVLAFSAVDNRPAHRLLTAIGFSEVGGYRAGASAQRLFELSRRRWTQTLQSTQTG